LVIGGLIKSFEQYKAACELIYTQLEKKLTDDQEKNS
jgi:hypothetical protein